MATALAACKILREMSHLETEAEVDRATRGALYEQLALGEPLPGIRPAHAVRVQGDLSGPSQWAP